MKTPQEIAEMAAQNIVARHMINRSESETGISAFAWALGVERSYEEDLRELVAEAIELDRAQRAEIHPDWRDDQESVRDADHVSVSWTAHDKRGRNIFQSDIVITAEQAVGMFRGIGEAQL